MKTTIFSLLLLCGHVLFAQTFTEKIGTPFSGVWLSSVASADIDGDGDADLLIVGEKNSIEYVSDLFINDGIGTFTKKTGTPFDGVMGGAVGFEDLDNDGDIDLIITGQIGSLTRIAKLYINDGTGNFTFVTNTPFEGVASSSVAFSDVDGDSDIDLLIAGSNISGVYSSKLYINDGSGGFSLKSGTPFEGVSRSAIAFSDVDGDGDEDLFITGYDNNGIQTAKLYINDGTGSFTEKAGTSFEPVDFSAVASFDVDGDGDLDLLVTGRSIPNARTTKLYLNDGTGNFTLKPSLPFEGVSDGSLAFADIDVDGDFDLVISGSNDSGFRTTKLFLNDGSGNFTENSPSPFEDASNGSLSLFDADGDGDFDLLNTGRNNLSTNISRLYINSSLTSLINIVEVHPISIHPNPSTATFHLHAELPTLSQPTYTVLNQLGQVVWQAREEKSVEVIDQYIDLSTQPNGIYHLRISDGSGSMSRQLVVQR